jgi:1-acyl-sn-glycerol-3-phosphate acyltransferase
VKTSNLTLFVTCFQVRLCLYPEGTRNSSSTLLPFKKGAFHVAIASQAPIQPIIVSRYYFLDDTKKLFNPGMSTDKGHRKHLTVFERYGFSGYLQCS